jgi:hypothetical protein
MVIALPNTVVLYYKPYYKRRPMCGTLQIFLNFCGNPVKYTFYFWTEGRNKMFQNINLLLKHEILKYIKKLLFLI